MEHVPTLYSKNRKTYYQIEVVSDQIFIYSDAFTIL